MIIAVLAILLVSTSLAWGGAAGADYTCSTMNAREENVLTRYATMTGKTKAALMQDFARSGLRQVLTSIDEADKRNFGNLYEVATTAAQNSAQATLEASIATPNVTNPGDQTHAVSAVVNLQIVADDADGLPLIYVAQNLPPGLAIEQDGRITGTITSATGSPWATQVRVRKFQNVFTQVNFTWTVLP